MNGKRVKITGIGPVTPAGIGREAFWQGIQEPISRVTAVSGFPKDAGPFISADVTDFDPGPEIHGIPTKRMPRHTQMALHGALLAIRDAGLEPNDLKGEATIISVGAALMDFGVINRSVEIIRRRGPNFGLPTAVTTASVSSIGGTIAQIVDGPTRSMAFQSACCSGVDAIGHAAGAVSRGEANFAICGGTEAPLYFHPMIELKKAGLAPGNPEHPQKQCRPFDLWRTTGVIGEGACIAILEPEESPRPALGWVRGYSYASDTESGMGKGLRGAIEMALANAGLRRNEIDAINAWGPGHRELDAAETQCIRAVFGEQTDSVPAFSIKGAVGNPLGAAGAMQVAATLMGFDRGILPPTVNWSHPDPNCALHLSAEPMFVSTRNVIINTHGISGSNACLVLSK